MLSIWNPWAWACLWPPNCRRNRISCFLNLYAEPSVREFLEKQVFIGKKTRRFFPTFDKFSLMWFEYKIDRVLNLRSSQHQSVSQTGDKKLAILNLLVMMNCRWSELEIATGICVLLLEAAKWDSDGCCWCCCCDLNIIKIPRLNDHLSLSGCHSHN